MANRTRTYLAGDWDGESDAIGQIYSWNEGNKWSLHFVDAHGFEQCYDTSMPCTIKNSLSDRMGHSKTFVLVVGSNTKSTRKGSCAYQECGNKRYDYLNDRNVCGVAGKTYSTESFIDYECKLAYNAWLKNEMKIVVLYNASYVDKSKCPDILKNVGNHVAMKSYNYARQIYLYDYNTVKKVIE